MNTLGQFGGVGVGPGERGLIPVIAWEFVQTCDLIFVPRARTKQHSVARACLPENDIPEKRFREIAFTMDSDRTVLSEHYAELGRAIAEELRAGTNVAYLTIGDPLTYSTYIYVLAVLKELVPDSCLRTFPGVTSYSALAAATGFPLGESKERVLILPCPDDLSVLRSAVETNDIVVLMKIGERLGGVVALLNEMNLARFCSFGRHVGMEDQLVYSEIRSLDPAQTSGYLATMLIRKKPVEKRHQLKGGVE